MLDLLYQRRSIRRYKQIPIEKEKVEKLIKAALLAPSSKSALSQRFIVVDDKGLLEQLSKARISGSSHLKNASLGIVILGDSSVIDVWVEDTAIAGIILQLTAKSLGLGACWIQIRERMHDQDVTSEEYVRKLLSIPEQMRVECMISIGYPEEEKPPKKDEQIAPERVFYNTYGKSGE